MLDNPHRNTWWQWSDSWEEILYWNSWEFRLKNSIFHFRWPESRSSRVFNQTHCLILVCELTKILLYSRSKNLTEVFNLISELLTSSSFWAGNSMSPFWEPNGYNWETNNPLERANNVEIRMMMFGLNIFNDAGCKFCSSKTTWKLFWPLLLHCYTLWMTRTFQSVNLLHFEIITSRE